MTTEPHSARIPTGDAVGLWIVAAIPVVLQFRVSSVCIFALFTLIYLLRPRCRRNGYVMVAGAILAVSLVLPFDVALGNYHFGSRRGSSPGGPHFVKVVHGMPMHTRLIETEGEYVSVGCTGQGIISPKWLLVWN